MMSIRLSAPFRRHFAGLILTCGMLLGLAHGTGCATKPLPPVEPPIVGPEKIAAVRESILKSKPGSLIGQVIETFELYAAVTEIPVKAIKLGDTLTFIDPDGNPVNNGTIAVIVDDNTLHVKFDPTGKRPVQKGDLAVWLKE